MPNKNNNTILKFIADKPIENEDEDLLNRKKFIEQIGEGILQYSDHDSLTLGLYGEWGSGKSSIINLTKNYIAKNGKDKKIEIIDFNPWNFAQDANNLILSFFNILEKTAGKYGNIKKLKRNLKKYNKTILYNTNFNIGVESNGIINTIKADIGSSLHPIPTDPNKTLEKIKKDIEKELTNIKIDKIVVIIDNIDRLSDIEIQRIFQLVNSLANFKNIIYLLSFDKNVVETALNKNQYSDSEKYLEKIIQVAFDTPKIRQDIINEQLIKNVDNVIGETNLTKTEWDSIIGYFEHYIKNMRNLKRYLNTLNFLLPINNQNIYPKDFLLITLLNLFEHEIYEKIKINKTLLTQNYPMITVAATDQSKKDTEKLKKIFSEVKIENENIVKNLIFRLFPTINFDNPLTKIGYQEKDLRVCFAESFDNYFALNLAEHDVSSNELKSLFTIMTKKELNKKICEINKEDPEKIPFLLNKFEDYVNEPIENKTIIFQSLMDIGDTLYEYPIKENFDRLDNKIYRILINNVLSLKSEKERFELTEKSIKDVKFSIFTFIKLIQGFCTEINTVTTTDIPDNNPIFNKHIDELKIFSSEKICELNIKILMNNKYLKEILTIWSGWKKLEEYWKIIGNEILKNDEYVLKFIQAISVAKKDLIIPSTNINDYTFNFENIQKFIEIDELNKSLLKIPNESLNETEKQYKNLFLKEYDKKFINNIK